MVNKKQAISALFILAFVLLTLIYLSQTTVSTSTSRALSFSSNSNNVYYQQTLSKLPAIPALKTSSTPCSDPSTSGCQSTIAGAGTCGSSASLNGGAICIWSCTPQSCQITESIVTMYQASSLNALFLQLNNLLSELGSSSSQLTSMSSQLSTSSSQVSSGSSALGASSSDAQTVYAPMSTAAINMNSQAAQLGNSISSLNSASSTAMSPSVASANTPSSKLLLSSVQSSQSQNKDVSLQGSSTQSQINNLISQINSDESQINAISSQSVASTTGITNANGQLVYLSSQLDSAVSQINNYNSQIETTASQANYDASIVGSDASQISSIASNLQSAASQLGPSGAQIAEILSEVISFTSQIASAVSSFQPVIVQVDNASSQISSVSSQISSYANQIDSYTVAMALANTQINSAISQMQSNTSQAEVLGLQIESDASQIQTLESQMGAQGSSQVAAQAAQVGTSAANFVSSSAQLGNATSKASSAQAQVNSAMSQVDSGTQQIMSAETALNSIASQFSQLGPQLSSQSGQINSIAGQIGPVISQIASMIFQLSPQSKSESASNALAQHLLTPLASSSPGFTASQVLPGTYVISPTNSVASYNYQSAPYYITCPLSPEQNPTDQQYIYTQISPWIVGNECAAGLLTPPLLTITTFTVNFNALLALIAPVLGQADTNLVVASAAPLKVSNPGTQTENALIYSPEVGNSISDAFSSQFYIYQHSPSFTAHSIWEWYGNIANFSNAIQPVYLSQYFPTLYWTPSINVANIPVGACTYSYSYKAKMGFIELANNYIPFNVIVPAAYDSNGGFSASTQDQFQATVLPYFSYQYSLNAPGSQLFQIKESIYNPSTYYTPYNSIDEFPINSTSLFFASYPTSAFGGSFQKYTTSFLEAFQRNGMGVNAISAANVLILAPPSAIISSPPINSGTCPNQDYNGQSASLSLSQVVACAQNAGFSGPLLITFVSMAYQESGFNPGIVENDGTGCVAEGILQLGQGCHVAGAYPISGYNPNTCSTYQTDKDGASSEHGVWFNPTCAFKWAYAYYNLNPGSITYGGYAFWGSYLSPASFPAYCNWAPTGFSGTGPNTCPGGGLNKANLPWSSLGLLGTSASSNTANTIVLQKFNSHPSASLSSSQNLLSPSSSSVTVPGSTVTAPQFFSAILTQIGAPSSQNNIAILSAWAQAESSTYGLEDWNPLDTTQPLGGSCGTNSANVQEYVSAGDGEMATAQTLENGYYPQILLGLEANKPPSYYLGSTVQSEFATWGTGTLINPFLSSTSVLDSNANTWQGISYDGSPALPCTSGSSSGPSGNSQPTQTYTDQQTASSPTFYNLANPISIAASPTDYLYVLNYSPYAPEQGGTGGYFINIFRVFPNGRYNMSIYPPNVIGSTSCSNLDTNCNIDNKWAAMWNPYWQTTTQIQQNNTVFLKSIDLTALTGGSGTFDPNNVSTDNTGDIFISGQNTIACGTGTAPSPTPSICRSWSHLFNNNIPEIVKISNIDGSSFAVTTNTLYTMPAAATPEVASSPTGAEIFLAGPGNGRIYVINGNSLSYQGSIDLSFSKNQGQSTTIGVNVMSYFADNGLYNYSIPFLTNPSPNPTSAGYTYFDTGSFHHPLGIQDINGYLYVLDDWQGQSGSVDFAELMYRVINTTGFDVPINPSFTNDLWKETQCQQPPDTCVPTADSSALSCSSGCTLVAGSSCSVYPGVIGQSYACVPNNLATSSSAPSQLPTTEYVNLAAQSSSQFAQNTYPPYGWVLSANITSVNDPTQSVTFCSSELSPINQNLPPPCTYYPGHMPKKYHGNYLPVGPALVTTGLPVIPGMGYSVNNNGTTTILFPTPPPQPPWWKKFLQNAGCTATFGHFFCPQSTLTQYQELLFVDYNVQNYTNYQTSQGAYKCYISDLSNPEALVSSGCFGSYASNPDSTVVASNMNALSNMQAPIYTFNDPFKYLISSGSQSIPSYDSAFYTTFSVNALGGGSGNGGGGINYVACANAFSNSMSSGCNGAVNSLVAANEISNYINSNSLASPGASAQNTQQILSSEIYGNLLVPYMYQFSIVQQYTNFVFLSLSPEGVILNAFPPGGAYILCQAGTALLNSAYSIQNAAQKATPPTYTVYYYKATKKTSSNILQANVQSGPSYLSVYGGSNNNYYQPNLSDQGTIISPQLLYLLRTNRQIGDIYVNITPWNSMLQGIIPPAPFGFSPSQDVLNATVLENYQVTLNMQLGALLGAPAFSGLTPLGGYETITANDITPQQYGQSAYQNIQCAASSLIGQVLNGGITGGSGLPCSVTSILPTGLGGAAYATANTGFNFTTELNPNNINLFSEYKNLVYADNLFLYLNGSTYIPSSTSGTLSGLLGPTSLLGYNRLIYVINDVFNNSIYVPLDADIANTTKIKMNLNPTISSTNPNQTTIYINGTVGYYTDFGTKFVPLANAPVYLYYGADINYVNYNPNLDPIDAMLCTYGFGANAMNLGISASSLPTPQQCQLANPAFTAQLANSDQGTYHPQYYSGNSCAPAANSLLTPLDLNCNIYGKDGNNNIPQTCGVSPVGQQEFCVPIYSNGTGVCTTQIGLIGGSALPTGIPAAAANPIPSVTTNANGVFTSNIVACGIGNADIIASFYGLPGNEPYQVTQSLLGYSAQPNPTTPQGPSGAYATFNVLNFYWAPTSASVTTQIGLYELSYGEIGALALVVLGILTVILVAYAKSGAKKLKNKKVLRHKMK